MLDHRRVIRRRYAHALTMDNRETRKDEIDALSAIYADDWVVEDLRCNCFSLSLTSDIDITKSSTLRLEFKLPAGYPSEEKPSFVISAPWMSREDKASLNCELNDLCEQHQGESVLYILAERVRQTLGSIVERNRQGTEDTAGSKGDPNDDHADEMGQVAVASSPIVSCDIPIVHGNPLVDRKSAFQAHLASVHSVQEAQQVLAKLMENRKISAATHNMWAYRITKPDSIVLIQNCDDDGETHAGSRLLHLLQIVDAKDVLVIVSRWYGGIQLGPDRFKHINNVARELLLVNNYISTK